MSNSKSFKKNFVLIDYENVQPKNLPLLTDSHFQIYLFLGAKQGKIDLGLVETMHILGPERSKYVKVTQTRPNALDFHISFYLGELASIHTDAYFHVISKDKGFDPLIEHLNSRSFKAFRRENIADIPVLGFTRNSNITEQFDAVVRNLIGRGNSKPRKEKTLKNTIRQMFRDDLTEANISIIFKKLAEEKYIALKNGKISYLLPESKM